MWLVAFLACENDPNADSVAESVTSPPYTLTDPKPPPCEPDPSMRVVSAEARPGRLANQASIVVTTSADGPVAVRCVSERDPSDVHLVEDELGTTHVFDLGGLLVSDRYECAAAAICPRSEPVTFTIDTGAAPKEIVPVTVTTDPILGMTGAYTLFNLEVCRGTYDWLHVVDPQGRTRWWHAMPLANDLGVEALYTADGQFVWGGGYTPLGRARAVDPFAGEVYDSASTLSDYASTVFHHDGKQLADGRILTLESQTNWDGPLSFEGFEVRVHDPSSRTVSWSYNSQAGVDEGRLSPGGATGDVWHANWADVLIEDGLDKLYVSLCDISAVVKIDVGSRQVEWVFGRGGDFTLVDPDGRPLPASEFTSCQHGLEVDGQKLLVYDNGWRSRQSRITEYELDTSTWTATRLWSWTDGWYMCCLGDVDYLRGGRVLVNQARFGCGAMPTHIREVVPATGAVASTVTLRASDSSYRAERIDGCDLFANTAWCPATAARAATLAPLFEVTAK